MPTLAATDSSTGFDEAAFDALLSARNEPDWLVERRRHAFDIYQDKLAEPLDPEEFKRVDLRTFRPELYGVPGVPDAQSVRDIARETSFVTLMQHRAEFGGAVVHVDGAPVRATLNEQLATKGVLFGSLSELLVS